jgi:uncharacterized membrane protein
MGRFIIPPISILFYFAGILVENTKQNWFIGIRTPWTLSNEKVWEKTHKIGGKLFRFAAVIIFFGLLFPKFLILFIFIPVMIAAIYPVVYSYFEYKREIKS